MKRLAGTLAVVAALVACPAAAGHSGGTPGYTSAVTNVTPNAPGVSITVVDRDDRIRLENSDGREIVIYGYDGEPYLRFSGDRVYRNVRSPATYLNDDRFADVEVPAEANAEAEPQWEQVAAHPRFEWHDHRIHWMSPIDPPQVRENRDVPHHVFDWTVTGNLDGEPLTIAGTLDYAPIDSGSPPWIFLALPIAALALAGGIFAVLRRRRGSRAGAT
jgi:hypothetical protein